MLCVWELDDGGVDGIVGGEEGIGRGEGDVGKVVLYE